MTRAIFLDRDGTLIQDVHYLKDPADIKIIKGVPEALRKIKNAGYLMFMHTNQSGIARGYYDWEDVHACNQRMLELYNLNTDFWDGICIAPESPDGEELGYRKPSGKYELEMVRKYNLTPSLCWMIGDKWIDAETGLRSNMNAALVRTGKTIPTEIEILASAQKVPICEDLSSFCRSHLF
jgi:D-glycero-D-manno-heptose 1,7-bisphosphate phosphatase